MNLVVYGVAPIIAQGISRIADKLSFIKDKYVTSEESEVSAHLLREELSVLIMSLENFLLEEKWHTLISSSGYIRSILVADIYMLKAENIALDMSVADIIICKDCKEYELNHAFWAAKEHDKYFCSELLDFILSRDSFSSGISENSIHLLSEREVDVLKLIGKGFSSQQIAEELFISKHTVNSHRKRIMQKLSLTKSTELVQLAATNFK
ncbi:hypothetical protein GCM10011506_20620 [Marivirga lumbricoides]|uniref:HTH luxR-type domain-containing protein n=1 Tax=Marivirga lumbricoides TaxID=1046115 RepID=A0ABQ1M5M9_9BACT|nr:hypothetical protein GCM10011506_20620 [Marivirga lumbricoides]